MIKYKSEEDRFVKKHPYEVHLCGKFHARFTNLLTALHTAKEIHGSVLWDGDSVAKDYVLSRFVAEERAWEANWPVMIQ